MSALDSASLTSSTPSLTPKERLIIALDVSSIGAAQKLVHSIGSNAVFYKVGLQLFTAAGPAIVRELVSSGKKVFLDLKIHEIPNSAAGAVKSAAAIGASMVTVHASGGTNMLRAAAEAAAAAQNPPLVLAVTVVTSLGSQDLLEIGQGSDPKAQVLLLAKLAQTAGCGGVVASPHEVPDLRAMLGAEFQIITPGVRPTGSAKQDQARTATPGEAIRAGANYLVVGRPISGAPDPAAATKAIVKEIEEAG